MKKAFAVALAVVMMCFSGCGYRSDKHEANLILEDLLEALENDDAEAIKDLFAVEAQNECPKLDKQIEEMLEYFEGNIKSYDKIGTVSGGMSVDDGKLTRLTIGNAHCDEVVTDSYTYIISFAAVIVNEENKDSEGVWRIWIGKSDDDYMIIGVRKGFLEFL